MRIALFSYSKIFGETLEMDILVSCLNYAGHQAFHFGLTTGAPDRKMIDNLSIELIGILYSFRNKDWNTSILDYLHESFPHSKICMMIDFPDGYDQELLMVSPHIDYVLRGEREQSFCELVGLIERHDSLIHCPGLTYRDSENRIIRNSCGPAIEDLNVLPLASKEDLTRKRIKHTLFYTSRGCPYQCSFCMDSIRKGEYRVRSIESVVAEIDSCCKQHIIHGIHFTDDTFHDAKPPYNRVKSLANELINHNIKVLYTANFRAEFSQYVDNKTINLLLQSGLYAVLLGIESGNETDLQLYNKKTTVAQNQQAIDFWRQKKIHTSIGFINFNPYSTMDTLYENLEFLSKNDLGNLALLCKRLWLIYDTEIYKQVASDGLITDWHFDNIFNYHFYDTRIELLYQYISDYYHALSKSGYNDGNEYFEMMAYLNQLAHTHSLSQVNELALDYTERFRAVFKEINTASTYLFSELLMLLKTGWSKEKAVSVTKNCFSAHKIANLFVSAAKLKEQLLYKLYKLPDKTRDTVMFYLDKYI